MWEGFRADWDAGEMMQLRSRFEQNPIWMTGSIVGWRFAEPEGGGTWIYSSDRGKDLDVPRE